MALCAKLPIQNRLLSFYLDYTTFVFEQGSNEKCDHKQQKKKKKWFNIKSYNSHKKQNKVSI